MNIKGLDYNTQREPLALSDYGREIQKMVDHAVTLPTKAERQHCAETIVKMMLTRVPQMRGNAGYKQTLWDHLFAISGGRLDIDWPNDTANALRMATKPKPMPIPQNSIRLRHYGHLVEQMTDKLKEMPAGKERDTLVRHTANQMKRDLAMWGHGSVGDERVVDDMARMTDGVIQLDLKSVKLQKVTVKEEPKKGGRKRR